MKMKMKMKKMFSTSYIDHSPILKKRTCLSSRSSSLKFCFRSMLTSRRAVFNRTITNIKVECTRINSQKLVVPYVTKRPMAFLAQLEKLSYKSHTRFGIEQDISKNPFGSKNGKPHEKKNHLCLTDNVQKKIRTLTSSTGDKGIAGEFNFLAAPGKIMRNFRKGAHHFPSDSFKKDCQYFHKDHLKWGTLVRNKFTKHQIKNIDIGNARFATKLMILERKSPEFYIKYQKMLYEIRTMKHVDYSGAVPRNLTAYEEYQLLKWYLQEILKEAKRLKLL